ncbi:hypothetical protein ACFQ6U_18835 [Streptomyces sp. NPDC056465]|uniref:hypothetical protein n=1 Tax=Streptomyces sp. NPDC056465 TaxID=3345829 RepID=UPI00368CB27B
MAPTWYVPYNDSVTPHTVHTAVLAPTDPDEHTALMLHLYEECFEFVTVHCITAIEALALGAEAIAQRQQSADTSAPQEHFLAHLPFAQAAARIFCADVDVHYRVLEVVYDFAVHAYRHLPYNRRTPTLLALVESFDTQALVGLYQHHWLVLTGRPDQALTFLSRTIGELPT